MDKGNQVKVLRKESYWFKQCGTVVKIEKDIKYSVLVRFTKFNYSGLNSNYFSKDELSVIS